MPPERVTIEIEPDPVFAEHDPDLDEVVLELTDWTRWAGSSRALRLARLETWIRNAVAVAVSGQLHRQTSSAPTAKVRIEVDLNPDAPPEAWRLIDQLAAELRSESVRIVYGEQIRQQCRPIERLNDAIARGDLEHVRALLAEGISINSYGYDSPGFTPLGTSIEHGQVEIAKYLVAHGADVNRPVQPRWLTPVAHTIEAESDAASQLHREPSTTMLELLLAAGADPNASPDPQKAPLIIARSYANARAVELLLRAGAKSYQ